MATYPITTTSSSASMKPAAFLRTYIPFPALDTICTWHKRAHLATPTELTMCLQWDLAHPASPSCEGSSMPTQMTVSLHWKWQTTNWMQGTGHRGDSRTLCSRAYPSHIHCCAPINNNSHWVIAIRASVWSHNWHSMGGMGPPQCACHVGCRTNIYHLLAMPMQGMHAGCIA
jgi:hypothetical protein